MENYFYLIVILPLAGFAVNILFGKRINSEKFSGIFSSLTVFISFIISILALTEILNLPESSRIIYIDYLEWINAGSISLSFRFLVDPLSVIMILIVTGVGFLIHIYSIGYMHNDENYHIFFAYMNLFIFAMLILLLADNFVLLFLGWEGVGLCSYLLIGFWYEKKFTGDAAKKAFVVNRIGDFGFMIAMFLIFINFNTLNISDFNGILSTGNFNINQPLLITIALLFFAGATGKSAQIPLFVWLPDAMAGPTPVSALIHAATMVTAGVYLVARNSILYVLAPDATFIILMVAVLTAIITASIAIRQNDIKKILAYSTISQLGFMFIALGNFAFAVAIFHLMTHSFFKALLFLGSGSVIHSMNDEQDITKMGGLKSKMKITYLTFIIGALAISGIPPLSGFFSKDEILYKTMTEYGSLIYIIALLTAGLTAFYMFRLVALTFNGQPRYDTEKVHPHESPAVITIPLIILAALSAIGGFIGLPHYLGLPNLFGNFLKPVFEKSLALRNSYSPEMVHPVSLELILVVLSVIVAVIAIIFAYKKFSGKSEFPESKGFAKVLENKYYVDEFYDKTVVNPVLKSSEVFFWKIFDIKIIDGFVNLFSGTFLRLADSWRKFQSGVIQDYTTATVIGIVIVILYLLFK
ncbi:MAG: NADH-quinone oxidoreductase subunit L [Ignavibacteria bacterium]|nr:NADH-quinone oxidoreductase subunit L [Ignavibacteria bacterium]